MGEQEKAIFARRLRELRARLGLTQKDFAKKAGITAATLSAYESGQKSPSIQIAMQIAVAHSCSLDWLCGLSSSDAREDKKPFVPDLKMILSVLAYFMREPSLSSVELELRQDDMPWGNVLASIDIKDNNIYSYLNTIQSLVNLNREGTLDDDMFTACVESAIQKTLKRIEHDKIAAFVESDDGDVPF